MWQVLFFVNPATVALSLAGLLTLAGIASKLFQNGTFRKPHARILLAALSVIYFSVLLIGFDPLADDSENEGGIPEIQWNPFHFVQALHERTDTKGQTDTVESFGQTLPDGSIAFYSQSPIDADEPPVEAQNVEYFVHGEPDELVVRDKEGEEASDSETGYVDRHMSEAIERSELPNEYESLIIEEKVMNFLLFVPIGIVAVFCFSNTFSRLLYGPLMSFAIEGAQWFAPGGNVVDSSDFVANSLGAWIGAAFASMFIAFWARRSHKG